MPVLLPPRSSVNQRSQLGVETTPGTLVPATKRLPNFSIMPTPHPETKTYRGQGVKYSTLVIEGKEWSTFKIDGPASYGELPYIFASLFTTPGVPTALGSGAYQYVIQPNVSIPDSPLTFSIEHGDTNYMARFPYGLITDATLTMTRDEMRIAGTGIGQAWSMPAQVQTLTPTGTVTGGTFTITVAYNGTTATTAPIAYNASNATVLAALQALSNVTATTNNVAVGGGPLPGSAITLTWGGQFTGYNMPLVGVNSALITGGGSIVPTLTTPNGLTLTNDAQTITTTGTPTGGTFTLTFGGFTTAPIAYNATAAAIATALNLLPSVPNGAIVCTGGPLPTGVLATFGGNLGGQLQPLLGFNDAGLTGGASPHVVITHTTPGTPAFIENVPCVPNQLSFYLDTTPGALGTTLLTAAYSLEVAMTGHWGPVFPVNAALGSFGAAVELPPKMTVRFRLQADGVGENILNVLRVGGVLYFQAKAVGPAIGGGNNYQAIINLPIQVSAGGDLSDLTGVYVADWTGEMVADQSLNYAIQISVVNKTPSL